MNKFFVLLVITSNLLLAYSDWDGDGVEDKNDKCHDSKISDIVDNTGCKVTSTKSEHHFDILLGISTLNNDEYDNTATTLQLDYYYQDFSFTLSSSQFDFESVTSEYSEDGQNDYYLSSKYRVKHSEKFTSYFRVGAIIPSDNEISHNKTDYFISKSLNYQLNKDWDFYAGVSYTFVGDEDTDTTEYQNSFGRYLGVSYKPITDTTLSLSLSRNASIYTNEEDIEFVYFTGSYNFTKNWFAILSLGQEFNDEDKDSYSSFQVGYYF
jgi:hypothetical protein